MIKERDENGKIKKSAGRPKGSKNKTTEEIREKFQLLIENNLEQLEDDLKDLKPKDRINCITDLASYVLPKMKATEISGHLSTQHDFSPIIIDFTE